MREAIHQQQPRMFLVSRKFVGKFDNKSLDYLADQENTAAAQTVASSRSRQITPDH